VGSKPGSTDSAVPVLGSGGRAVLVDESGAGGAAHRTSTRPAIKQRNSAVEGRFSLRAARAEDSSAILRVTYTIVDKMV